LFIFCNPADNFDVGVDGCVSYLLILVRHRVLFLLAILAT